MLDAARKVVEFSANLSRSEFLAGGVVFDAVAYNLLVLGEAAGQVDIHVQRQFTTIP